MFGLLDWIKVGGSVLLGLVVAGAVAYPLGRYQGEADGYARAQVEARDRALELIEERSNDNAEISDMDMAALCDELGGRWMPVEGRCD